MKKDNAGFTLDGYEIQRKIGTGGFGEIYLVVKSDTQVGD